MKRLSNFLFLALVIVALACREDDVIRGTGPVVTRTLTLEDVSALAVSGSSRVVFTQGSPQEVTVRGQANLIDVLSTEVENGTWNIRFTENVRVSEEFTVFITLPTVERISVSGSGEVRNDGAFEQEAIDISVSGSGEVSLTGEVDRQTAAVSGSGTVSNYGLTSRETVVTVSGSGDAQVTSTETLDATVSGSGDIRYRGNPTTVNQSVNGSGSISQG